MAEIKHFKVVASLPSPLEPDSIYYVRVGLGYDQYVTNGVGVVVAYEANSKLDLESKVDKEVGKQLSDENYTLDEKNKLASLENYDDSAIQAELDTKVDKIAGKGLSTEDFTSAEKGKLAELENFDDSAIQLELDTKVDKVVGKQLSTEDYSTEEKNKLAGVEAGAQVNSVTSVAGKTGDVTLNKADVGLSNVDNTSDSNKPVSTPQQAALNLKLDADANAVSASKLVTPRTISLSGDASGSTSFDGSANATIVVQVADDSHNHVISNVDGLQTALDSKVDKADGKQLSDENYTLVEKNKLAGVAVGATANATNAQLRDRTTHTGVQPIASVEGLQDALGEKVDNTDSRLTNAREWTASVVTQAEAEAGTSTTARKWTAQRVRQAILGWWNASTFKTKLDGIEDGATKNATDAQLRSRATHTGVQPISSVTNLQSSLDSKVDKQSGYGLSQENYTPAEKSKLSSLEGSKFKGEYISLSALQAAQPSPEVGSYAYVDIGVGEVVTKYIWDSSDAEWVKQQGETASVTPAEVKSLYEGNPDTNAFTDSEKSKLSGIQAGATANATNAQLRDRATHTGVQPISSVSGLQAGLDNKADTTYVNTQLDDKVDKTISVVAGTGLSGGGTLAENRTLSVNYGTTAGTAAQGNDSRLSDSREWTATVVTQVEAEAGTATTARKWTAQRIRQAILGWWNGSPDKTKLDGIESGAQVNSVTSVAGKTGAVTLTYTDVNAAPTSHTHPLSQITDAGNLASLSTNASTSNFLRGDGTWATPPNTNTTYTEITTAEIDAGTATALRTITGRRMKYALDKKADVSHTHTLSQITDAGSVAGISTNGSAANFLRGDGTWVTPPNTNTTYSAGTGITLTGTTFSLADERFTSALLTKLGGIATGATANSTDAQLRARSTHTGTQAMSTVDGLETALGEKVDTTDSRLSDSREWTAAVVSQAEAEAGTATTERKWTAQRVAQAISALGLSIGTTATTAKAGNWMPTWANVTGKPTTFTPSAHTHSLDQITDAGSVASLNTTGSTTAFLRGDGTWATPPNTNTTYSEITTAEIDAGTASTSRAISGRRMQYALDKKADAVHGHSISDVTGLQTGLDSKADTSYVNTQLDTKVDKTISVVAGTGLSGGGTLSANRTLSVNYGTTAGTAVQGNDSRLSDSREWTAAVVSQAEAEAGAATTARKWTAQRVAQAISALGLKIGTTASTAKAGNWTPTWSEVSGKPATFTPESHTHTLSEVTDAGNLAALNTNASTANFLRGDGTWVTPPNTNTTYAEITTAEIDAGTATTLRTITGRRMKYALDKKSDTGHGHVIGDVTGLQTAIDSKANTTTQVIAGTGLSGGGTLAANRTLSVSYGTTAGTAAQGNDTRIVNATPNTRQIIAGTGLTGGGTLAADRTLSVSYGTTAGTAAQGNDSRLSNSREWTAAAVTQAEAEAGTATTARKWTAQRVRQAILGWWNASADKTKLDGIATGATANATDAQLRARSSHTGTQAISTVAGLQAALDSKVDTEDWLNDRPFTIAVTGDSLSTDYQLIGSSWPAILEDFLNKSGEQKFRVVSFCTGGNSTYRVNTEVLYNGKTARQGIIDIDPDLVLVAIGPGDHVVGAERTMAQTKADALELYSTLRSQLRPGVPICHIPMVFYDTEHVTSFSTMRNRETLPYFWSRRTTGILAGMMSMEIKDDLVNEHERNMIANLQEYYDYVASLPYVDHVLYLDLYRIARIGGLAPDGLHVNKLGSLLEAGYIANALTPQVHSVFSGINIKGFVPWEDVTVIFNNLLKSEGGEWVDFDDNIWIGFADYMTKLGAPWDLLDTNNWAMGYRMTILGDRPTVPFGKDVTIWFAGGRRNQPVYMSVNGGAFLEDSIGRLDANGNMLNHAFPIPIFGPIEYQLRYRVDGEVYGPLIYTATEE